MKIQINEFLKARNNLIESYKEYLFRLAHQLCRKYKIKDDELKEDVKQETIILFFNILGNIEERTEEQIKAYIDISIRSNLAKFIEKEYARTSSLVIIQKNDKEYLDSLTKIDIKVSLHNLNVKERDKNIFLDYIDNAKAEKSNVFLAKKYNLSVKTIANILNKVKNLLKKA